MISNLLGKRKNFIINPAFQWTLIRWTMALSFLTSLIYLSSNIIFFRQLREMGVQYELPTNSAYFRFLEQQEDRMHIIFLVSTLFAFGLIIGFGVYISHRIAGPIYRMCLQLNNSTEGEINELNFRKKDFFPELAEAFNKFRQRIIKKDN